jgi:hypothetical protein
MKLLPAATTPDRPSMLDTLIERIKESLNSFKTQEFTGVGVALGSIIGMKGKLVGFYSKADNRAYFDRNKISEEKAIELLSSQPWEQLRCVGGPEFMGLLHEWLKQNVDEYEKQESESNPTQTNI